MHETDRDYEHPRNEICGVFSFEDVEGGQETLKYASSDAKWGEGGVNWILSVMYGGDVVSFSLPSFFGPPAVVFLHRCRA